MDGSGNIQVELFQGGGSVDFVVDVNGYYALLQPGVRTVVVSPVGTPAENGAVLLAALAGITTNAAGNPWLLKLEPGIYDVGTTPLVMKDYVDLEGSGEDTTTITGLSQSSFTDGTVDLASSAQIRFVTIANTGGGSRAVAIGNVLGSGSTNSTITHTTAMASGSASVTALFLNNCSSCTISSSTATAEGSGGVGNAVAISSGLSAVSLRDVLATADSSSQAIGIDTGLGLLTGQSVRATATASGSGVATGVSIGFFATLTDSTINVSGGTANTGVSAGGAAGGGPLDLSNVTITVQGPASSQNTGLLLLKELTRVKNSEISAAGGSQATGIQQNGNNLDVQNSTITGQQATTASYGISIDVGSVGGLANVNNSTIAADTNYIKLTPTCHAFAGSSQLKGGSVTGGGTAVCAGVFDGSYTFFASTCP